MRVSELDAHRKVCDSDCRFENHLFQTAGLCAVVKRPRTIHDRKVFVSSTLEYTDSVDHAVLTMGAEGDDICCVAFTSEIEARLQGSALTEVDRVLDNSGACLLRDRPRVIG